MEKWSNDAALGYAQEAARNIGLSPGKIDRLILEMYTLFELRTVKEAAEKYRREG